MRILCLTNMYPPHHYGGLEVVCAGAVDRLRARGHDVSVLTGNQRHADVVDPPDEASAVHRTLNLYWDDHRLIDPPVWRRWAVERANQRHLRAVLDAVRPDVVSVWGMGAMSLGLLTTVHRRGIPMVYCVCDDWLEYGVRLDAWARIFVERRRRGRLIEALTGIPTVLPDLGRTGTFCWISEWTRDFAEEQSPWTYPDSTTVWSGIDESTFPVAESPAPRPWGWRLLYAGRIDERKGVATAIRAMAELPDATLDIDGRGDDDERARLVSLAADLGVAGRVTFQVSDRADLPAVYRAADVVVFPSQWDEPFGLVPLEAMACATPVVATGTGGSAEFLADGHNCLLFPPGDAQMLAATVTRLAGDDALRRRLVAAGVRTAAELTLGRLVDVLEQWHDAAAEGFEAGRPAPRPRPTPG